MTQIELQPAGIETEEAKLSRELRQTNELLEEFHAALAAIGLADSEVVLGALALAIDLHEGDRRSYEPYINHPLRVAIGVIRSGVTSENVIAAALLHDTIEDHEKDLEQIARSRELVPLDPRVPHALGRAALTLHANEEVASIVTELSHTDGDYDAYLERLASEGSSEALLVKTFDFGDNATPPEPAYGSEKPEKRTAVDKKQVSGYQILIDAAKRLDVSTREREKIQRDLEQARTRALGRLGLG